MSAAVLRRGFAAGWKGLTITTLVVAAMLVFALAVYADIDLSIYTKLPEAVQSLLGIPPHADPALMAYNEMLASLGALAYVGIAIAVGAQAVAGEEQARTLHLSLATPTSRTSYLVQRALAMFVLIAASGAVLWVVAEFAPKLTGTATGDAHVFALIVHLTAVAAFHAALAFAIGAATGRKPAAAGVAVAVMLLGWLGSSLLPIWNEHAADWLPWTWFNGSKPLVNGVDGGDLALLLGGAVLLIVLCVIPFARRELRLVDQGSRLIERLRANPMFGRILAPTGKGGSLFGIRLAAQQVLVGYVVFVMGALMGFAMPFLYKSLSGMMGDFAKSFPQTMADLFGGGDLSTPAGFLHLEVFGMMAPAAVILVATVAASSGIAGEERTRRMSLLLAQPISRTRTYWTIAATMVVYVLFVAVALFLGGWAGLAVSGIDVDIANLAWACALLTLLGWCFGGLALLISGATGRSPLAVWITTFAALATYFGYTLLLAAGKADDAWWSPFRAYLAGPPLMYGAEWWQPVWLAVAALVLVCAGLPLFLRRDLKITAG